MPLLAAVLVVGARQQQPGELAVRAGARLERDVRQAGDLGQRALEAPHQLERALRVLGVLQRVQPRVAGQRRDPLVQLRVVLHRARAERVEAGVEVEVLLRERVVVAHDLGLGDLGQLGRLACGSRRAGSRSATPAPRARRARGGANARRPSLRALVDRHRVVARSAVMLASTRRAASTPASASICCARAALGDRDQQAVLVLGVVVRRAGSRG